ncbi:MAG: glycerol-3-phosphate 1-O-acyltransferase PlsY [Acidobacteriota bacterium]
MTAVLAIAIAYLLGSIPFGYVLTRLSTGRDVRASGSGNIGATNVMRTAGRTLGITTLVLDIAKGVVAVAIAQWLTASDPDWMALSALAVSAGHVFPVFLNFQGGKAVATFAGGFGYLMPLPLLATFIVFVIAVAATQHISAGSILGAATFPLGAWIILHPSWIELLSAAAACTLIVYRHRDNVHRIHQGTESRFHWSKG